MTPQHLELYVLGASLVASLALIAIGALRVVRNARTLQARIDGYERLPVVRVWEATEPRLAAAQRRAAGIPRLQARTTAAFAEIERARARAVAIAQLVRYAVRKVFAAP